MTEQTFVEYDMLPEEFTVRPATLEDAEAVAELVEIYLRDVGYDDPKEDPDDLREEWQSPDFDLGRSSQLIFAPTGEAVGQVVVFDASKLPVHPWVSIVWHPDYNDTELPRYLWEWAKNRAMQAVDRCPPEAKVSFKMGSDKTYRPKQEVFEAMGMKPVRHFFRMLIRMDAPPPVAQLVDGLVMRTYQHPDDLRDMATAVQDGFRDHWGYVEEPVEEDIKHWRHFIESDRLFDGSLWFMPRDVKTGAIAGVCFCRTEEWGQPEDAYVLEVAVVPAYRKQGVALAMLHHAFGELYRRGHKSVALHVDASSLTGATRLYEKAGMHVDRTSITYEYVLREGEELATTSLED